MARNLCPWDDKPVDIPQATCDYQCYQSWYAWRISSDAATMMLHTDDGWIWLAEDNGLVPLTLEEQPWYQEELHG